jgi:SAM-dependent methyltransferase
MVCDMMARLGARRVTGIDIMQTTGCNYPDERIDYRVMDATRLECSDRSFDLVYSIATFEHLPQPQATLGEMRRALRVGGFGYVQAGPLFYSPFGHHMFAYFGDQPWIHLRWSKAQIAEHASKAGIAKRIQEDLGLSTKEYLGQMLSKDHINGLKLLDYGLDAFCSRSDVRVVKYHVSKEGEDLLTDALRAEIRIKGIRADRLTEHGFELLFQRIA